MSSWTLCEFEKQKVYRIIPSTFPVINFFEDLVDPSEMEVLWEIEGLTNERIRQDIGDIFLVAPEDRVAGPGSSVVMAAFTHVGRPSRFTTGGFGVYYAGFSRETAIKETVYHREKFLAATQEPAAEITMRLYEAKLVKPLVDIRDRAFNFLHHPDDYLPSQQFASEMRPQKFWGLAYNSVRHTGGQCIALFRPPAISMPKPINHLRYVWNGEKIVEVFDAVSVLRL